MRMFFSPRRLLAPSLTLAVLGFTGCAHTYNVKVDALCHPEVAAGTSYRIVPHDDVKADFDPAYAEAVQLIETALAARGYFPAAVPRDADMVVEVDLGIGSKRKRAIEDPELFGFPVPQQVSPAPANARNVVAQNLAADPELEPPAAPPRQTRVSVITFYQKYLTVSARETDRATGGLRAPVELWRVNVAIEDAEETVDDCLPVLVVTAIENIGHATDRRENVRVSDKYPSILLANAE